MGISLQTLHDSLLQYFNILKNSLVELINRDYADFVNLSTNLVGLDKIIKSLEDPLVKMRLRVTVSHACILSSPHHLRPCRHLINWYIFPSTQIWLFVVGFFGRHNYSFFLPSGGTSRDTRVKEGVSVKRGGAKEITRTKGKLLVYPKYILV